KVLLRVCIQFLFLGRPGQVTLLLSCATPDLSHIAASPRRVAGVSRAKEASLPRAGGLHVLKALAPSGACCA
uniref:Uncharacterized protein n=1 Tax=Calidris pygmaea TaxID=425635 RepID=A0A8C3JDC1_9CHAR